MRNSFLLISFLVFNFGFSQFENQKKTIRILPLKKKDAPVQPTSEVETPAEIKYETSIGKEKEEPLLRGFTLLPKKEEKSIFDVEPVRQPSEIYTEKFNQKLKEEGLTSAVENRDFFLGQFIAYEYKLNLSCRDYGAIDGDNVRIWLNNELVIPGINLESGLKSYNLDLKKGENIIQIEALNTGEFFPNTGQFLFFDGGKANKLITNQYWNLNSGYKAIIKIIKKDGIIDKE